MKKNLLNIAIAPLIYDNKILLLKRNNPPFKGLWGMPGGKSEFGEHIESTIKREIFEETGLTIQLKRISAVLSEIFCDTKTQEDYWHAILFLCEVNIDDIARVRNSSEGNLQWFNLGSLDSSKTEIIPSDYEMIKRIVLRPKITMDFYKIRMLVDGEKYTLDYFET